MGIDNQEVSNGWTQYQKLVLAELTRHELNINSLRDENIDHKMTLTKIDQNIKSIKDDIEKIRDTQLDIEGYQREQDKKFDTQQKKLDDKFNEQKLELEHLKWKVTASIAIFVFVINAVIHLAGKLWKWW